ncbi:MAG: low molecular weight phosphatase family protein [Clostridia bacterium]|nr:low molecular weight phosphatase family protein [Clostridia bacterium]
MTVIFVCTGNTCRSPMAEGIAKNLMPQWDISSAGLMVSPDESVARNAVWAMDEIGIDISNHIPRQLDMDMADSADYIVPMTESHRFILQNAGVDNSKILDLGEPVPDPYGGDLPIYEACRDKLCDLIKTLSEKIK